MQRSMAVLVALAVLLVGCTGSGTDPDPTPSPTPSPTSSVASEDPPAPGRVAVVVSPHPAMAAETAADGILGVTTGLLDGTEVRVATADDVSFVEDMTAFFVTEGYDLVCAIGPGAEGAVRRVARSSPSTRFCAAPARANRMPDNVLPIDVRVEELGYLAGVALGTLDGSGPTGFVTDTTTWAPQRVRIGLAAGLAAAGVPSPAVSVLGPRSDVEGMTASVEQLLGQGMRRVLSLAGAANADVLAVLERVPVTTPAPPGPASPAVTPSPAPTPAPPRFAGLVTGPEVRPTEEGGELSDRVLALVELHLEQAVAEAVRRHVGDWDTSPASIGLSDGVFRVEAVDGARRVAAALDEAVTAIRTDQLDVPAS